MRPQKKKRSAATKMIDDPPTTIPTIAPVESPFSSFAFPLFAVAELAGGLLDEGSSAGKGSPGLSI